MEKIYDEKLPGIVGVVRQYADGHLLMDAAFYRDENLKKVFLAGKRFVSHRREENLNCFEGDVIRITNDATVNLTAKYEISEFGKWLTTAEKKQFASAKKGVLFEAVLQGIHLTDKGLALRFFVTEKIAENNVSFAINRLVGYVAKFPTDTELLKQYKGMYNMLSCLFLRDTVTLRYYCSTSGLEKMDMLSVVGSETITNADNFIRKKCRVLKQNSA